MILRKCDRIQIKIYKISTQSNTLTIVLYPF